MNNASKEFRPLPAFLKSLRYRISLGIVVILAAIILIIGQFTAYQQRQHILSQADAYGRQMAEFLASISQLPLQKFSYYQLETYVAQLEKGEQIAYCEIFDQAGNPVAHSANHQIKDRPQEKLKSYQAEISDGKKVYGRVELVLDLEQVMAEVNATSLSITIASFFLLFIIALTMAVFVHRSLVSPLLRLTKTTSGIASGQFTTSSQDRRPDEIGLLAASINSMSTALKASYHNLEKLVDERTTALNSAKLAAEATATELEMVSSNLQAILDNSPVGIVFASSKRTILRVNQELCRIFGYSHDELIGQTTRILYASDEDYNSAGNAAKSIMTRGEPGQLTLSFVRKDGTVIVGALRGRHTRLADGEEGIIWSLDDITFRLKMEEELLKIKKLESIGVLAGGIAHDFNNMLAAIMGNISLAEKILEGSEQPLKLLKNAKNASLRAKDLTVKLLTFARGGDPVLTIEQLPEIIRESTSFVLAGSHVSCQLNLTDDLWPVRLDKGQISQVIQNLVINAVQAMPDGGAVTISCCNQEINSPEPGEPPAGTYVRLTVEDKGVGIPQDSLGNIFDPYFSTKKDGSGLGLAIVHSIITKHRGKIGVDSAPGAGTTFTIFLPASPGIMTMSAEPQGEAAITPGRGKILLMDDEETIQLVVSEMLGYLGYQVMTAGDGSMALALYQKEQERGRPFDAVLMDLTIPGGMGGKEAVTRLLALDPQAKVIVSSGYSEDPVVQNYRAAGFIATIAKPYQLTELSSVLAEVLSPLTNAPPSIDQQ